MASLRQRLVGLLGASLVLAGGGAARAERPVLGFDGLIDLGLVYDTASPPDRRVSGFTVQHLDRLPLVNVLSLGMKLTYRGLGVRVAFAGGNSVDALHNVLPGRVRPRGAAARFLLEGHVGYRAPLGRGLTIEAGVFPSHIGFESFLTKDNWNATHGWLGELSPYYQAGVRASYPVTERLTARLLWLNGWNLVTQDASFRSGGAQLAFASRSLDAAFNLFVGPAQPGASTVRTFGDLWARITPLDWLSFAVVIDGGVDPRPNGPGLDVWYGLGAYLRLAPIPWYALALRAEVYDDRQSGRLTGTPQRLAELSITSELRFRPVLVRLEGRIDRSTASTLDGGTGRELLVLSVVASF